MVGRRSPLLVYFALVCAAFCITSVVCDADDITVTIGTFYSLTQSAGQTLKGFYADKMGNTSFMYMMNYEMFFYGQYPNATLNQTALSTDVAENDGNSATLFRDPVNNVVWIGASDGIILAHLNEQNVTFLENRNLLCSASFVDVSNRTGYFVTVDGDGDPTLYRVNLDRYNISFFSYMPISISQVRQNSLIYDASNRVAYLGGKGGIEIFDMQNGTSYGITQPDDADGANWITYVLLQDVERQLLYACYYTDDLPVVNVYNTSQRGVIQFISTITLGEGEVRSGDYCTAGMIDTKSGEIFYAFSQSSGGSICAIDAASRTFSRFTSIEGLESNEDLVGMAKADNLEMFVVAPNQIIRVAYTTNCPNDCSGHGECDYGTCVCYEGYETIDCSSRKCPNNCNNVTGYVCADGTCLCPSNYTGEQCQLRRCPNDCNSHGICSNDPLYECSCTDGWSGIDCSIQPPPAPPPVCPAIKGYKECVGYKYCGWCGDILHGECMAGDIDGPVIGACREWNYHDPPEIGVIILASIILAIVGFMFILDIISAIRLDVRRGKELREEYMTGLQRKPSHVEAAALWWRDQRAAKAWTTLEHLQFLSFFSSLALDYPTRFLYFTRFVYWSNLGIPFPPLDDKKLHMARLTGYAKTVGLTSEETHGYSKRSLLGIEQYSNSLGVNPHDLYAANMFWFGVLLFGGIVLYGLLTLIFVRKAHWRVVFSCRLVYVILRVLQVAYMGVVMTCAYTFVHPDHDWKIIVPAAITMIIVGGGYPLAVYLILKGKGKQLFENEFKFKYGCLYVNYRPEKSLFSLRIISRKFFTGVFIGVLAFHLNNSPKWIAIIQACLLAIAQIIYFIDLIRSHPYYDHFHEYLEYFLIVVNIVTIGLALIHYNKVNTAAYLITALIQILALVACFGTYIISWMQMHPGFSFRKIFCCGGDKEEKYSTGTEGSVPMDTVGSDTTIGVN